MPQFISLWWEVVFFNVTAHIHHKCFFGNKIFTQSSYAYFRKLQGKNNEIYRLQENNCISNVNVFWEVLLTQNSTTCNVNVMPNYAINLKAIQLFAELLLINDSRYCTHFKCKGVKLTVSFFALRKCFCVSSWLFDFLSTSLLHLVVFGDVYIISCSSKHVELFAFLGAYVIGFKILIYCKKYLKRTISYIKHFYQ